MPHGRDGDALRAAAAGALHCSLVQAFTGRAAVWLLQKQVFQFSTATATNTSTMVNAYFGPLSS